MRPSVQPAARLSHQDNYPMSVIWDWYQRSVLRFTENKAGSVLYVLVFGDPAAQDLVIASLAADKNLFNSQVKQVSVIGRIACKNASQPRLQRRQCREDWNRSPKIQLN